MGLILTPGSKKRLLEKLDELTVHVRMDQDRETIMFYAAGIIPAVISELNYYTPKPQRREDHLVLDAAADNLYMGARKTKKRNDDRQ